MAKMKMLPGGRADRAVKSVKRAGLRAAGGAAVGAAYAQGLMIDPATPRPMIIDMMASLQDTPTSMLIGAGLGVAAGPVVKGLKHVMNKTQFKGN
jgi:hypothetical protein